MGKKRRGKIAGTPRHSERMRNDICSFDRSPGKFWLLRKRSSLRNPVTNLVDECEVNFLAAKSIQCGSSYIYTYTFDVRLSSRFLLKQDLNAWYFNLAIVACDSRLPFKQANYQTRQTITSLPSSQRREITKRIRVEHVRFSRRKGQDLLTAF